MSSLSSLSSLVRRYCSCCCRRASEPPAKEPEPVIIQNPVTGPPTPIAPPRRAVGAPPGQLYVSLWDFQARTAEELCFNAGDLFQVIEKSGDWWKARKVQEVSGTSCDETGYIPQNYLAEQETGDAQPGKNKYNVASIASIGGELPYDSRGFPEETSFSERWLFGEISRSEATNMLMCPENKRGTFLIRASEKQGFEYALSVRDFNLVRHFKILQNHKGLYHVNNMFFFPDMESLIKHYKEASLIGGLILTRPCVKQEPVLTNLSHDSADVWERPREEFELGRKLGSGNFGDVFEAVWQNGRVPVKVAIKVMKADVMFQKDFQEETKIMKKLQHRHLLTLYAICSKQDPYYIITELMPNGDLLKLLRSGEGQKLTPNDLLDMAYQVVDGMEYLESKGYIHRDLAARNILVGKDNLCKIADFGLARIIKDDVYLSHIRNIPYKWTAPEALSHGRFSTKADIWSFGVLLFEIVTRGQMPYTGLTNAEVLDEIVKGYRMPRPKECSEKVYSVMRSCWEEVPTERPTFAMLKVQFESLAYYEETEYYPK